MRNNSAGAGRPVDWAKVKTRTTAFTDDQMLLKQIVDRSLPEICADAETGIALLSYMLSELILRTARPGMLPEAVATAVRVLQFNCGVAEPVTLPQCPHGYALPERGLPPDCEQCARDRIINRGGAKAALMLDGHAINCQCDACNACIRAGAYRGE